LNRFVVYNQKRFQIIKVKRPGRLKDWFIIRSFWFDLGLKGCTVAKKKKLASFQVNSASDTELGAGTAAHAEVRIDPAIATAQETSLDVGYSIPRTVQIAGLTSCTKIIIYMSLSVILLTWCRRTAIALWVENGCLRTDFKAGPAFFTKRWVNKKPILDFTFYCTCGAFLGTGPTPNTIITYLI